MMQRRDFDLGDILSCTTGLLVSPRKIEGVYDILNFMTGDNLFTHQLPRACRECAPVLLRQHPQLAEVTEASAAGVTDWAAWLDEQKTRFGDTLPVEPCGPGVHERIDPISELVEKVHPGRIIVAGR